MGKKKKLLFGEWQLCPKCLGTKMCWNGTITPGSTVNYGSFTCDVCNGTGIIQKPIIKE